MRAVNRPVSWWGWHWQPPVPMSIVELIAAGTISPDLAALLWVGMERGASAIVSANPPLAGKTTTLTALLSLTPPETVAYFSQGMGESFTLPPLTDSHPTYLLVNEISDHLPVYTWGEYARRTFELVAQGYSLGATIHADSVAEVIGLLEGVLGVPRRHIAQVTFILQLQVAYAGSGRRRLKEVAFLTPQGDDLSVRPIARWNAEGDRFAFLTQPLDREAFARWAGLSVEALEEEMKGRAAFLEGLLRRGVTAIPQVDAAIQGYYAARRGGGTTREG